MSLGIVSIRVCSLILPNTEVRLTKLYFCSSSLCSFLKMGCHNFSNTMNCVLATSSDSFLRIHECISLSPINLCTFKSLRWSQTWTFPTAGGFSFSQSLPLPSVTCMVWLEHLPVQIKAKKDTEYLNIFHNLGSHVFLFLQEMAIHLSIFWVHSHLWIVLLLRTF